MMNFTFSFYTKSSKSRVYFTLIPHFNFVATFLLEMFYKKMFDLYLQSITFLPIFEKLDLYT